MNEHHRVSCDHYDIEIREEENLILEVFRGRWTHDVIDAYGEHWRRAVRQLSSDRPIICLSDVRGLPIQAPEMTDAFEHRIRTNVRASSKIAILSNSPTMDLQAKRVAGAARSRVFANEQQALDWLREGEGEGDN